MSSGAKGGASRVSIPSGVWNAIENIKEITGQNHSEDEIYAMLKECSMDPNETTQKLLALDTFHEVKRKRDRRKENLNKESKELKLKPGPQARPSRVVRGNYPSRYTSHDAGGGRNSAAVKENATSHLTEKGISKVHLVTSQDMRKNETSSVARPIAAVSNGPSGITSESAIVTHDNHAFAGGGDYQSDTTASMCRLEGPPPLSFPTDSIKNPNASGTKDMPQNQMLESTNSAASIPSAPASGSFLSSSDPVLLPSPDFPLPSSVVTVRREAGSQHATSEFTDDNPTISKSASAKISTSEVGIPNLKQKMPNDFSGGEKNHHLDPMRTAPSAGSVSGVSRPSSNYNNRSQVIGLQKVGPGKEWKPKSTHANTGLSAATAALSEVSTVSVGGHPEFQTTPVVLTLKEAAIELQKKLEDSHISDSQHVIIPNHLHVPEVEKLGFCFGSFDATFGLDVNQNSVPESDQSPSQSESSETIDEPSKESQLSNEIPSEPAEDIEIKHRDHPQSPSRGPQNFSSNEVEALPSVIPDYSESKPEVASGSHQNPAVHTTLNYNFGFMPPIFGGQLTPSESTESQAHDGPRLPGFVVPQSFDAATYYAQFYRSGLDSDGRISPFHPAGTPNKYNGNAALVSSQTSQTPQELQGGIPLVLPTASPTPLVTQAAGVMQSSISASQQPLPVFRQPTGVHLPHYPPNYIPYAPFFSPFYIPPPAFLSSGAFPQQPQTGNMYPTAPGTTAKYPVSQYKQGSNAGSSTHIGMPGSYGQHGLSLANYTSSSAAAVVTSTSNEDNATPRMKENNVYASGQQNEGSSVWFTTPSRDLPTLQASSFYNLPQGQLAFTPTQTGHGTFTGVFHPAQAVTAANVHPLLQQSQSITNAVDMVGPTASVYQQPQHAQLNWPSNY